MKLKTYAAPTPTEAMAQIRQEIGDDAIIIATREHPQGGVAITVVVENPEAVAEEPLVFMPEQDETDIPAEIDAVEPLPEPEPAPPPQPVRFSVTEPETSDIAERLYACFRSHRLPAAIGGTLMDLATEFETDDPVIALAAALKHAFAYQPMGSDTKGPIMAVGPVGGGKTQSLAKLAARAVMAGKSVTMITTDTDRTGRNAPYAGFAASLGCVLVEAPDERTLNKALSNAVSSDLVLIDTPGANHLKPYELEDLRGQLNEGLVEPVLVTPAGGDPVEAGEIAEAYAEIGVHRAIITRFDAVRRLGGALAIGHEKLIQLAHFGTGQRIKDGLADATPLALAKLMMPDEVRRTNARTNRYFEERKAG